MRMDENSNPEWKQMLRGSSSGRKALERIAELEQENERLRAECGLRQIQGYHEGMERAAELKEQVRMECSALPNSSIDSALQHYARTIRAEMEK